LDNGEFSESSKSTIFDNYTNIKDESSKQDFGYVFASSLSESSAFDLVNAYQDGGQEAFGEKLKNYINGIDVVCGDPAVSKFSICNLLERMSQLIENDDKYDIPLTARKNGKVLPVEMRTEMGAQLSEFGFEGESLNSILSDGYRKVPSRRF